MTLKEIKDYIVARIYPNSSQKITGEVMQDALSKMADASVSPSGDPMHYTYLTAYKDLEYDENTGLWSYLKDYGGLVNLSTAEVRKIFCVSGGGFANNNIESQFARIDGLRTNFAVKAPASADWGYVENSAIYAFLRCSDMEVAVVDVGGGYGYVPNKCQGMFFECRKMHTIIGVLNLYYAADYSTEMFKGCEMLREVRISNLRGSIVFADSTSLSKDSILYMISNSAATSTIYITLHPTVYAMANADVDIKSALASKPDVKLASA